MYAKHLKAAAAIALVALLSSCGGGLPDYDYRIDMKEYESAITAGGKAYLVLVNKQNPCGKDYAPRSLAAIPSELTLYGKEVQMESTAATAAEALVRELRQRGYVDIAITSGYRSIEYQQILFNTYLGNEMTAHPTWSQEQCEAQVLTYSARPWES